MKKLEYSNSCATKLRILADPTRLAVMEILLGGPQHVGEINRQIRIDQSLLSHHLKVLRESGFVESCRDGKAVLYRLSAQSAASSHKRGISLGCCELALDRRKV